SMRSSPWSCAGYGVSPKYRAQALRRASRRDNRRTLGLSEAPHQDLGGGISREKALNAELLQGNVLWGPQGGNNREKLDGEVIFPEFEKRERRQGGCQRRDVHAGWHARKGQHGFQETSGVLVWYPQHCFPSQQVEHLPSNLVP